MDRRLAIFIAILVLTSALVGSFLWHGVKERSMVVVSNEMPQSDYQIVYTAEGYQPDQLDIPIGSRVEFKNTTEIPMWTASDPHPVHSDFASFDAQKAYYLGETFVFQFKDAGTFGFHNHEKSIHRGIIHVIDPDHPLQTIDKTKESQRSMRDKYLAMLDPNDPNSIFILLDTIKSDSILSQDYCHDMAHDLGHRAYEMFGFSGAMTFSNPEHLRHAPVDDVCGGGYMHGILEEIFLRRPALKKDPGTVCSSVPDDSKHRCFHGVGHGLMFVNKRDYPASLLGCRQLEQIKNKKQCFEGASMELFWGNTEHTGADSLGWTKESILLPCMNAKMDEKPFCFLYAHLGYLRTNPKDFNGVVKLCTQNGLENRDIDFCLKGVGVTMIKHFTEQHLEQTEKLVEELDAEKKYSYYSGVIAHANLMKVSGVRLSTFCDALRHDAVLCRNALRDAPSVQDN